MIMILVVRKDVLHVNFPSCLIAIHLCRIILKKISPQRVPKGLSLKENQGIHRRDYVLALFQAVYVIVNAPRSFLFPC